MSVPSLGRMSRIAVVLATVASVLALVAVALAAVSGMPRADTQGGSSTATSSVATEAVRGAQMAPEPVEVPAEPEAPVDPVPAPDPVDAVRPASSVVVIDAGHQGRGSSVPEPIGPGSTTTKARVTSGTSGCVTGAPEHVVNLEVALLLKSRLEARGVRVVMVRESAAIDISNSERALLANEAGAALTVRLHCDGNNDSSLRGVLTIVPAANQWTGAIVAPSRAAGELVHAAVLAATGARDRGISARGDMTGFNWSQVPAVIVEMGLMTNAEDDRLLSDRAYQERLATGIADGVVAYLSSVE